MTGPMWASSSRGGLWFCGRTSGPTGSPGPGGSGWLWVEMEVVEVAVVVRDGREEVDAVKAAILATDSEQRSRV